MKNISRNNGFYDDPIRGFLFSLTVSCFCPFLVPSLNPATCPGIAVSFPMRFTKMQTCCCASGTKSLNAACCDHS